MLLNPTHLSFEFTPDTYVTCSVRTEAAGANRDRQVNKVWRVKQSASEMLPEGFEVTWRMDQNSTTSMS